MIQGKIDGSETAQKAIRMVPARVLREAKKILTAEAVLMAGHARKDLMSGPRPVHLGVRTGNLRSSTKPLPVKETSDAIETGIGFGTIYARPHIGPKGQVTTIRAKSGKFLAIPLMAAMTPSGVARGAPRSGMWGETFIARSRKGNLILFGKRVVQKGKSAGEARGAVVPLFVLKKEVRVKTRVFPEDILAWERPRMLAAFRAVGVRLKG